MYAAIGRHPNSATGFDDADLAELEALAAHPSAWRSARPGSTTTATTRRAADQERAFEAQIELARETGKPLVIHTRAADDDTLAMLAEHAAGRAGDPALLLDGRPDRRVPRAARLVDLVRRQRHLPEGRGPARGGAAGPAERLLVETDAPYLSPQAVRGKPNQPANVVHTAQALAVERRVAYEELERRSSRSAAAVFGW